MLTESVNQKPIQVSKREPSAEAVNSIKKLLTAFPKNLKLKKKLYGPFLWMGFNCLKATATSRRQFNSILDIELISGYVSD